MSIFNVMHPFHRAWKATCPRCSKRLTETDFICSNCGRGQIKAADNHARGLGCSNCNTRSGRLQCSCGADITGAIRAGMARHLFP